MLTPKLSPLIPAQGIHWSNQRLLSVATQIFILIISMIFISNVIITLGERRLQEDWATQRYSELQAVGTLIADKVSFQQFRTQMFAKSELLKNYLDVPSTKRQDKLERNWAVITRNIPELLDIALFDPQGNFKFATSDDFGHEPLPPSLLGASRNMGGNEIYISPLEFSPVNGKLEPYHYQLAWLENPDQSIRGYLVTYNSMSKMLKTIKPAYSSSQSPLLMLDTQGLLYAGADSRPSLKRVPDTMGGSLKQSYPALWRKMAMSNFGQFHGDNATFVYLKVELTTQYETRREYFLVSYVRNADIAANFSQWRTILIGCALMLTLLASILIFLSHFYRLEQRSRQFSIELSSRLFDREVGCIIVNHNNRVISANELAATQLSLPQDQLLDRNLQRILQLDNDDYDYAGIITQIQQEQEWKGELDMGTETQTKLIAHIKTQASKDKQKGYLVITFEDVSQLKQARQDAYLGTALNDNGVPTALIQTDGTIIRANPAFEQEMRLGTDCANIIDILPNELGNNWPQISQLILLQGSWKGQVLCGASSTNTCLQATLKSHIDASGELDYVVCTFEKAISKNNHDESGVLVPHRSTILVNYRDLESYFNSLEQSSKDRSSLLLLDITSESMLSHMSDVGLLESRQKEVEIFLLRELPSNYQMSHWQLGKIIFILPDTDADQAHHYAIKSLASLNDMGLGKGICMGIASFHPELNLEQYLSNAEVALQRAKQIGEHNICQAFTR
ncbi:PAS domain-containing protein [Shewanella violacea]|uniref:Sensory box protein, putative n=1 Tax=Shewanella violacea (strain JCM 10179 / CIP 106290 / LMG 19151 / DSS12) TaxID=637905 RepID=D4ZG94_SHEVD|nr:PAS domain-containing protein [Shewanella violacea]BAJ00693.1 sensory box protein, putative [Shewanella violacea DSS12]